MTDRTSRGSARLRAGRAARRRRLIAAALAWTGAVLLSGTVAWKAVAVISDDSMRTGLLSAEEVSVALASARAEASALPTIPTPSEPLPSDSAIPSMEPSEEPSDEPTDDQSPTSRPSSSASKPPASQPTTTQTRTWQVTGGTVTAQCRGAVITLVAATPSDGWRVETKSAGPDVVEVELSRSEHETHLTATCQDGAPVSVVDDHHDSEQHEDSGSHD